MKPTLGIFSQDHTEAANSRNYCNNCSNRRATQNMVKKLHTDNRKAAIDAAANRKKETETALSVLYGVCTWLQ